MFFVSRLLLVLCSAAIGCFFTLFWLHAAHAVSFLNTSKAPPQHGESQQRGFLERATTEPFAITTEFLLPRNVGFLNPPIAPCDGLSNDTSESLTIVNFVATKPTDFDHRSSIRQRFMLPFFARMVFVTGRPVLNAEKGTLCDRADGGPNNGPCKEDEETLEKLQTESAQFGDVVIGDFLDVYQNLTWKTFTMLHWKNKYCPQASIMLKTADDAFPNFVPLRDWLQLSKSSSDLWKQDPSGQTKDEFWRKPRLWGTFSHDLRPARNESDPLYLSRKMFPWDTLPQYPVGPAYALSQPLVKALLQLEPGLQWLPYEKIWIGVVTRRAGGALNRGPLKFIQEGLEQCDIPIYLEKSRDVGAVVEHISRCNKWHGTR